MRTDKNKYPLRKIVGTTKEADTFNGFPIERIFELLECGHKGKNTALIYSGGLYGTQPANSRRCKKCALNKQI